MSPKTPDLNEEQIKQITIYASHKAFCEGVKTAASTVRSAAEDLHPFNKRDFLKLADILEKTAVRVENTDPEEVYYSLLDSD